jgi:hypothetical protein
MMRPDGETTISPERQIATGRGPEVSPTARPDHKNRPIPLSQSAGVTPRCCQLIDISDAAIAK